MGMSSHVVGIAEPDESWRKMKAAYDACLNARVEVPDEVLEFFGGEPPDDAGMEVSVQDSVIGFSSEYRQGFTVDLKRLPPRIRFIRFYNSF